MERLPHCIPEKTVTGIRAEFYYNNEEQAYKKYINKKCSAFHVVNKNQYDKFIKVSSIPLFLAPHGIDCDIFNHYPMLNNVLTIGYNGNPNSGGNKGFNIIEEACKELNIKYIS